MIFFILMYGWGVLSTQHYAVGKFDFLLHLYVTFFMTIGALGWFWQHKVTHTGISVYGWLAFAGVLLSQPFLHSFDYPDSLLFPVAIMLMASLVSLIALNISDEQKPIAIRWLSQGMVVTGVLTVFIQFLQLFFVGLPSDFIMPLTGDRRLYGNIAQINQTAFILVLSIVSLCYLTYNSLQNLVPLPSDFAKSTFLLLRSCALPICLMVLLSIGIGFTGSRAGLILLVFVAVSTLFYPTYSKYQKIIQLVCVSLFVTIGFQVSQGLLSYFATDIRAVSAVSRLAESNGLRQSLLFESWLAFSQHPIAGVGYGNFSLFGMTQVDKLPWLENANHAHNIIAQLGAEFGLLGLACFAVLIWVMVRPLNKLFRGQLPAYQVYSYLLLATILLYSLSEYPLWYARFLFLAAFLVGMLDRPVVIKKMDIRGFGLIALTLYMLALPYYIIQYYSYLTIQNKITPELGYQKQMALYNMLPKVYGYSKFQERLLFDIMLTDGNVGALKTALGHRVITAYSYRPYIEKQSALLAFSGQSEQANMLYHVLCKHEYTLTKDKLCPNTITTIRQIDTPNANMDSEQTLAWAKSSLGH